MEDLRLKYCDVLVDRLSVISVSLQVVTSMTVPLQLVRRTQEGHIKADELKGSRLIRLIPLPAQPRTKEERERLAIYNLMSYRFPAEVAEKVVKEIWSEVVEGRGDLWQGIGEDKKECIRGESRWQIAVPIHLRPTNAGACSP